MSILANKKEALIGGPLLLSLVFTGAPVLAQSTTAKLGIAFVSTAATAHDASVATRRSDNRRSRAGLTGFEVIEAEGLSAGVVMLSYDNETPADAMPTEQQGQEQQLAQNSLLEAKIFRPAKKTSLVELVLELEALAKSDELAMNRVSATAPQILEFLTP